MRSNNRLKLTLIFLLILFAPLEIFAEDKTSVLGGLSLMGFVATLKAEDSYEKKTISVDPYIGQRFYNITKFTPDEERSSPLTTYRKPDLYKTYPEAKKIKLPVADFKGIILEEAINRRRSKRQEEEFYDQPILLKELSQLLYSSAGITGRNKMLDLRSAPSAGALYPIEIYLLVNNVSGLPKGIYHYSVSEHALELLKKGDFRNKAEYAVMEQPGVKEASVVFIFTAIPARTTTKYDLRGWRYIYMEVGYISENLYLQATSLGLLTTAMGAFYDDEVNKLLGLDVRKEMALHIQILGRRDGAK